MPASSDLRFVYTRHGPVSSRRELTEEDKVTQTKSVSLGISPDNDRAARDIPARQQVELAEAQTRRLRVLRHAVRTVSER